MTALQSLPTLVAYGDSITQGHKLDERLRWTTMLQQRLDDQQPGRAPRVINAGVGGNTSAEGLARIDRDVFRIEQQRAALRLLVAKARQMVDELLQVGLLVHILKPAFALRE